MKVHYSTRKFEMTAELEKYTSRKTAQIVRKIPRRLRSAAICDVVFSQAVREGNKSSTCSMTLTMGDAEINARETTPHMYAALDIAVVDIEQQLKKYVRTQRRGLLRRRRTTEE